MTFVVAIDGPAGSGKSSVSKAAARTLDYGYLDTGAAYRALAWHVLETGVDTLDPSDITDELERFEYSIGTDPDNYFVKVGGDV
ncbi:MAG: (d)CMP kinase, partial [Actinobacteria bacterium]|nr:(d)CMP kinase [Actinomycetota bacterium]